MGLDEVDYRAQGRDEIVRELRERGFPDDNKKSRPVFEHSFLLVRLVPDPAVVRNRNPAFCCDALKPSLVGAVVGKEVRVPTNIQACG